AKVDGIEIGGRNLIRNTSNVYIEANTSQWYWTDKMYQISDLGIKTGDKITFSAYIGNSQYGIITRITTFTKEGGENGKKSFMGTRIPPNSEGFGYITITITEDMHTIQFCFQNGDTSKSSNKFKYKCRKVEKGNKATDWTPAPEDVDQAIEDVITTTDTKISKAKSDIKIETDKIALNVSNLTTKTTTIETQLRDKATKAEVKT
ncbi:hypothetical protein QUW36_16480, partial [Clostridium cadaveris]|nr:hypothetical protein [Clostridium cadaveris]